MAAWKIKFKKKALKTLSKMDVEAKKRVLHYLDRRIAADKNPRRFGKALQGEKWGLWRYRVGDIRIVVSIEDDEFIVLVVQVGRRGHIYR